MFITLKRQFDQLQPLPFDCVLEFFDMQSKQFVPDIQHILLVSYSLENCNTSQRMVEIEFSLDYPFTAPIVTFLDSIVHQDVINKKLCLNDFSPIINLKQLLCHIYCVLLESKIK